MKTYPLLAALILAGCAQVSTPPENPAVARSMREARGKAATPEAQAALYLQAAATAAPGVGSGTQPTPARETYNASAAELAVLLRTADNGRLWNHPLTVTADGSTYRLRFQPGNKQGVWAPDFFSSLVLARTVPGKTIKHPNHQKGIGGALVGVRKKTPREPFAPLVGVTAPVTATLDFQGNNATLALRDPGKQPKARVAGAVRPLAADFSAPLAYYPSANETITGLMGALRADKFMDTTGLYMLQPYDPDRIPLIFVHGLISTARMWRNVVNEIEADPTLRGKFQCWVFNYPTGNPVAYSALRFREDLAKEEKLHGFPHGFVLVGHSMGGIVSRMQAVTLDRAAWDREVGTQAEKLFMQAPAGGLIQRSLIFNANPKLRRVVFICTPHRGANMAVSSIGEIAMRLIALPANLTGALTSSVTNSLAAFTGSTKRLPNSITSLSPKNPTLKVVDSVPMRAPHHTILGDRGKGDSPNSSDGIVAYGSSHLDSALSQRIVPGPHGSCELPETIEELKRLLHLHLKTAGR
ncbi:MAG: alpha/beta hydrolase [Chthoniobacter sp.]|nr:alpha/beta hydrolase [Chthoniobacter sp.]